MVAPPAEAAHAIAEILEIGGILDKQVEIVNCFVGYGLAAVSPYSVRRKAFSILSSVTMRMIPMHLIPMNYRFALLFAGFVGVLLAVPLFASTTVLHLMVIIFFYAYLGQAWMRPSGCRHPMSPRDGWSPPP